MESRTPLLGTRRSWIRDVREPRFMSALPLHAYNTHRSNEERPTHLQ